MATLIQKVGSEKSDSTNIFLAIPTIGGLNPALTASLYESVSALNAEGIGHRLCLLVNDCHVDDARNKLVSEFLKTDCTDLVFIDSDISFDVSDLVSLCKSKGDVIGATYPTKSIVVKYPVILKDESEGDILPAKGIPTGFMKIKREVLEVLFKLSPKHKTQDGNTQAIIFERIIRDNTRYGGDYAFCLKVQETGFKVELDTTPVLNHHGDYTWAGSYKNYISPTLKTKKILADIEHLRKVIESNNL